MEGYKNANVRQSENKMGDRSQCYGSKYLWRTELEITGHDHFAKSCITYDHSLALLWEGQEPEWV